jgi:starch synthase
VGRAAALLTIHNLAYHGWVPRERLGELGLTPGDPVVASDAPGMDLLWAGIERSELVNTVSPGYAAEALTPDYGMGLHDTLRWKAGLTTADGTPRFFGILNGIDDELWDPATDADLTARYAAADLRGKANCRADLLARHGMDPGDPAPILGTIGRLDPQKGFDLVADAAPDLIELGARVIVQGSGDPRLADPFRALAAAHRSSVALVERFDRANARRIYAGSDLFLMPSRFEPCGQGQMIAFRYGTPPLVRRTGGLGDTVVDETERPGEGTGFVFDEATPGALLDACRRAFALRGRDGSTPAWNALIQRGMALDFGWEVGSAPRYAVAYRRAVQLRRAAGG